MMVILFDRCLVKYRLCFMVWYWSTGATLPFTLQ